MNDTHFEELLEGAVDACLWSSLVVDDGRTVYPADTYPLPPEEGLLLRQAVERHLRPWWEEHGELLAAALDQWPDGTWRQLGQDWWVAATVSGPGFWHRPLTIRLQQRLQSACNGIPRMLQLEVANKSLRVRPLGGVGHGR